MSSETKSESQHQNLYINRELSLLEFQRRVLEEALDDHNPLLERIKFLAIFGSNMDEFFMVRVSGMLKQVEARIGDTSADGLFPQETLAAARKLSLELYHSALDCFNRKLVPALDKTGIHIRDYSDLTPSQRENADSYFREVIHPVLTPLALDPGHPFPHISNLSLNLAIVIRDTNGMEKFARLKIPDTLSRLVPLKRSSGGSRKDGTIPYHHYFTWLEQIIIANINTLFLGMEVIAVHPFRIVRDADIEIQELEADDLLETMQQSIRRRKFGSVVQIAIYEDMPHNIRNILLENLENHPSGLLTLASPLGLSSMWQLYNQIERYDLKYPSYYPKVPLVFKNATHSSDIFDAIRQDSILVHHPYDSFSPVVDFLKAAARDPHVLAIKQTLYRVGQNSPVVEALLEASERGKEVAVLVELKARFDEQSNIEWARTLEEVGVHVVYGLVGLKTHSKIAMVIRKEGDGIRRYTHLATGNYNPNTARIYEDLGLFTCDEAIGADATNLFNYLTGYSANQTYAKLLVAPVNLRKQIEALIRREIRHAQAGQPARLIFKVNSIVDPDIITLLYEASKVGVHVDLIVRGICCLRPGVAGLSENITVTSIVGRYLEHSRIFYFQNNGHEEIYLGSADLMQRNLNHRVEVVFPIENPHYIRHIRDDMLEHYLCDNLRARVMQPNGRYKRKKPHEHEPHRDVQQWFMNPEKSGENSPTNHP